MEIYHYLFCCNQLDVEFVSKKIASNVPYSWLEFFKNVHLMATLYNAYYIIYFKFNYCIFSTHFIKTAPKQNFCHCYIKHFPIASYNPAFQINWFISLHFPHRFVVSFSRRYGEGMFKLIIIQVRHLLNLLTKLCVHQKPFNAIHHKQQNRKLVQEFFSCLSSSIIPWQ